MGMTFVCPRCSEVMYVKHFDMYGPMCFRCKKKNAPPSPEQERKFHELMARKREDRLE